MQKIGDTRGPPAARPSVTAFKFHGCRFGAMSALTTFLAGALARLNYTAQSGGRAERAQYLPMCKALSVSIDAQTGPLGGEIGAQKGPPSDAAGVMMAR